MDGACIDQHKLLGLGARIDEVDDVWGEFVQFPAALDLKQSGHAILARVGEGFKRQVLSPHGYTPWAERNKSGGGVRRGGREGVG